MAGEKTNSQEEYLGNLRGEFEKSSLLRGEKKKKLEVPLQGEAEAVAVGTGIGLGIGLAREGVKKAKEAFGRKGGKGKGRGGSSGGGVPPEGMPGEPGKERPEIRPFNEIQEELRGLIDHADPVQERNLKMERARLLRDAKDAEIFESVRGTIGDAQRSNDFKEARRRILGINIQNREDEERGRRNWDENYTGMLDEYRDVAILNMDLALLRAGGEDNSRKARKLEREIEIRGWGAPPQGLEGMAREYLESKEPKEEKKDLTSELLKSLGGVSPEQERERWADVEYEQEFYTRFQPDHEPRFYKELPKKERDLYDARWQLARAAYVKKALSSFPDKYKENQDLLLLTKEQMEALYKMPGVKEMLWAYAEVISGTRISGIGSIWDCNDGDSFEKFRTALRNTVLPGLNIEDSELREADAVAWNLLYVGNLMESLDSRFSYGKSRHGSLVFAADEYRSVLHPMEKFESKCEVGLEWGAFGKWGKTQVEIFKSRFGFDKNKGDKLKILPSPRASEWSARRRGNEIQVFAPECYPATTTGSYWEETTVEIGEGDNKRKVSLWDLLLEKNEIPWDEVRADSWGGYVIVKFNKAVTLSEYFDGSKDTPLEEGKELLWAKPILDIFSRLGFADKLPVRGSFLNFHNLKVWAVYASRGGVQNPVSSEVTAPFTIMDFRISQSRLNSSQVGYLRNEPLSIR